MSLLTKKMLMIMVFGLNLSRAVFGMNQDQDSARGEPLIFTMPAELIFESMRFLTGKELAIAALVCKRMRSLADSDVAWILKYEEQFGSFEDLESKSDDIGWKERFRARLMSEHKNTSDILEMAQWPAEKIEKAITDEEFQKTEDFLIRVFTQKMIRFAGTLRILNPKDLLSFYFAFRTMRSNALEAIRVASVNGASNAACNTSRFHHGWVVMDAYMATCAATVATFSVDDQTSLADISGITGFADTIESSMAAANSVSKTLDPKKTALFATLGTALPSIEGIYLALINLSLKDPRQIGGASCRLAILYVWASIILNSRANEAFKASFEAARHMLEADASFKLSKKDALKAIARCTWDRSEKHLCNKYDASLKRILETVSITVP